MGHTFPIRPSSQFKSILQRHHQWVEARMVFDPGGAPGVVETQKNLHTEAVGIAMGQRLPNRYLVMLSIDKCQGKKAPKGGKVSVISTTLGFLPQVAGLPTLDQSRDSGCLSGVWRQPS